MKSKRRRCGVCINCVKRSCMQCKNCLDKYGGNGIRKQICKYKKCLNLIYLNDNLNKKSEDLEDFMNSFDFYKIFNNSNLYEQKKLKLNLKKQSLNYNCEYQMAAITRLILLSLFD